MLEMNVEGKLLTVQLSMCMFIGIKSLKDFGMLVANWVWLTGNQISVFGQCLVIAIIF